MAIENGMPVRESERLDGWKSISRFLGRNVRTVQLWERERGLPVQRIPGGPGQSVFAYANDLQRWLHNGVDGATASVPRPASTHLAASAPGLLVLPFEYQGAGGSDQAFIGGAVAHELLQRLTVTPLTDLRVLSWTTARAFHGNAKRADELARELGIRYLVEGAVLDAGSRWQVDIRLVDAAEDRVVFADRFGAKGREILSMQTTMADSVGGHLELHLAGRLIEPFWQKVVAPGAFLGYVRAAQLSAQPSPENLKQAVNLLEEACAIEPGFMPARASLALARFYCQLWLRLEVKQGVGEVKTLIDQCLADAPQLAATQYADGVFASAHDRDWERSDNAYRYILAALPSDVKVRGNLATNLMVRRRFDEAQSLLDVSRGLESSLGGLQGELAFHFLKGDVGRLLGVIDRMLAIEPRHALALFFRADALGFDMRDEASTRATIEMMDPLQQNSSRPYLDACIAVASNDTGNIERARDKLVEAAKGGIGDWFQVVQLDAVLGDADAGTRHLELAVDHHEPSAQNCAAVPRLEVLRRDKRFQAQVRRLNLPV
ncbi:MAG: hypothetical protein ABI724_07735 [Betaproteobacteria bacterium]